jgi:glycosyltransferase involved in cell wall biosynthesis
MSERPRRVLHVVKAMNRGGVETWLMHLLRHFDRQRVQLDFLVHTDQPGAFDEEIGDRKAGLIRCLESERSPAYGTKISRLLAQFGPYDVIHSHVHHFSGYLLWLAHRASIPVRIAHSHSDTALLDARAGWARRCYLQLMKRSIRRHATHFVGASDPAGRSLFGANWSADPRSQVLHCGIDLEPFRRRREKAAARAAWDIGPDDFVIGHVGRFDTPKNHMFLLEIAAEVVGRQPRTRLLLAGDGPLRQLLVERIRDLGIGDQVILTGVREDVAVLLSAMDVFVFPSLYEGLGLSLVEAQAAGLPCIISDVIPAEADAVPALIHRISLADDRGHWADCVLAARSRLAPGPADALAAVENSSFNISRGIDSLYALYGAAPDSAGFACLDGHSRHHREAGLRQFQCGGLPSPSLVGKDYAPYNAQHNAQQ